MKISQNKIAILLVTATSIFLTNLTAQANDNIIVALDLSDYPPEVKDKVNEVIDECELGYMEEYHEEKLEIPLFVSPGFITRADVTGDGINDYIVSVGQAHCQYMASIWGRFPYFEIYQGTHNNRAFPIYYGLNPEPVNYPRIISNDNGFFDVQYAGTGAECGQEGEYSFAQLEACEVTLHWNDDSKEFEAVSIGELYQDPVNYDDNY